MKSQADIHYGVIGMGPIGTTIAAMLRKAGRRVSVLCIDEVKTNALKDNRLTVSGELTADVKLTDVYMDMRQFLAGGLDFILITTKSPDLPGLLTALKKHNPPENIIYVSVQNGLDVEEQIINQFGSAKALRMVINMGCKLITDYQVQVVFALTQVLSRREDVDPVKNQILADDLTSAGFPTELVRDYQVEVYKKVMLNSSLSTVCALTGLSMVNALNDEGLYHIVRQILVESLAVGRAMGLALPPEFLEYALKYLLRGGDHKPSMLVDVEMRRRLENDDHCGRILHYAEKLNVPVPVLQTVYYLTRNLEQRTISH